MPPSFSRSVISGRGIHIGRSRPSRGKSPNPRVSYFLLGAVIRSSTRWSFRATGTSPIGAQVAAVYDDVLQGKLDKLWFRLPARTVAGLKAERQAMLLREFQIAALGSRGARDPTGGVTIDTARLVQADLAAFPNAALPAATVPTGLPDAATLKAIEAWLALTANLRAPVVFEARKHGPAATPWKEIAHQGFLFHDEDVPTQPRVFVSDFTGRYPLNGGRPPQIAVGDSTRWFDRVLDDTTKGIECTARQSRKAPFSPKAVTGDDWDQLSDAKKSNFRVVAAIAYMATIAAIRSPAPPASWSAMAQQTPAHWPSRVPPRTSPCATSAPADPL